jgi:tetratricopeptide (TPR) repeat protein
MTPQEAWETLNDAIALHQAYMKAPSAAKVPNLERTIRLYEAGLEVLTEQDFPVEWAMTMNNLANTYRNLPTGDRGANLKRAIECCEAALRVYTEQAFPVDWAATMNNLANAYGDLPTGDRGANLKRAIECYQAALRVRTEQAFPVDWAATMNNLANAYGDLPTGDRGANLKRAIECYQAALRVRTADSLPFDCLQTLRNLGDLYYGGNAWQQALDCYAQAVAVTEGVRAAALQESERRRVFEEAAGVFERAVLSALRTAQPTLALTLTERGKTRNLADHLWQREVRPQRVPEPEWQEYQAQLATAREWEHYLSATSSVDLGPQAHRERGAVSTARHSLESLITLRHAIAEMEARFRQTDPGYLPFASPLEMKDIAQLAAMAGAVIVEFRVTGEGTYVFLVGPEDREVTPEQIVEIQDFNDDALWQMLAQFEGDTPIGGWLVNYDLFRRHQLPLDEWLVYMEQTTRELYRWLLAPVHERLRQRYSEARRLILVPNKGLNSLTGKPLV